MSVATCHTPGCGNENVPVEVGDLTVEPPEGPPPVVLGVSCGPCGQPITDLDPPPEQPPPDLEVTPHD